MFCSCKKDGIVEVIGLCDVSSIVITPQRAWTQISIPDVLSIPRQKPPMESIEKVFVNVKIISKRIVVTPSSTGENAEGTRLTGRKLIVEGLLEQKIIYTADERTQPVHSADFCVPFSAFIVLGEMPANTNAYCVDVCVEDAFVKIMAPKEIFSNVTLLLNARPTTVPC